MNGLNRVGNGLIVILLCLSFVACNAKLEAKNDDQQTQMLQYETLSLSGENK
jgi:hypothetical protein